jgi:GTPase
MEENIPVSDLGMVSGEEFHSGFVTLVGRPNAGKSTLINAVMGEKLAITSSTPQTTRHRFTAVYDAPGLQLIMVDTPGIHKPHDALGEELNRSALQALADVDVIAFLIDATKPVGKGDVWISQYLKAESAKKLLIITKTDLAKGDMVELQVARALRLGDFDDVVALSALEGSNVGSFIEAASDFLPEGPRWFPKGTGTDQPLEVIIAEFIREKILRSTFDEVPHAVGVMVDELSYDDRKDLYRIYATVYVEHESQKGIIIGAGGTKIKEVGCEARVDLEHFLGARVFLDLRVKVKKDWRRDAAQIRRFGYGEGL